MTLASPEINVCTNVMFRFSSIQLYTGEHTKVPPGHNENVRLLAWNCSTEIKIHAVSAGFSFKSCTLE